MAIFELIKRLTQPCLLLMRLQMELKIEILLLVGPKKIVLVYHISISGVVRLTSR